jgi:hypothetical protein
LISSAHLSRQLWPALEANFVKVLVLLEDVEEIYIVGCVHILQAYTSFRLEPFGSFNVAMVAEMSTYENKQRLFALENPLFLVIFCL